jgi:hypothetical protein
VSTASVENPYAGQGAVLLDIGDDVGAVVVTMPAAMLGEEIEIRPLDGAEPGHRHDHHAHQHDHAHGHQHGHLPHVAVVDRPVGGERVPSLVFPEVVEGRYGLCHKGSPTVLLALEVRGGEVTTADWPG